MRKPLQFVFDEQSVWMVLVIIILIIGFILGWLGAEGVFDFDKKEYWNCENNELIIDEDFKHYANEILKSSNFDESIEDFINNETCVALPIVDQLVLGFQRK